MKHLLKYLMLFTSLMGYGQGKLSGKFTYEKQITYGGEVVLTQTEDLFYNGFESIYIIYGKSNQNPFDTLHTNDNSGTRMTVIKNIKKENLVYYKNYKTHELLATEILSNEKRCYVRDTIPVPNWVLVAERKQIGHYLCQKATTTFRCATYEAWFTTEIPLPIGPWKIGGLPGLIVILTNRRANITYKLLSAKYPVEELASSVVAPIPPTGLFYSFREFAALERKEQDKLKIFHQGSTSDGVQGDFTITRPECYDEK